MALKDRIIEIAYELKDRFTGKTGKILGAFRNVEQASDRAAGKIAGDTLRIGKAFGGIAGFVRKAKIALIGLFTATTAYAVKSTKDLIDYADSLEKLERRLGVTPEAMSGLDYAAQKSGVEFNTLSTALQRMTRRVSEAASGSGEAKGALAELGLEAADLAKLSPDQQFLAIADAMERIPGAGEKVRVGMRIFDSEGVKLIQTMEGGAEGIRALMSEAEAMGYTISSETAEQAAEFKDRLVELQTAADELGRSFAVGVLPHLTEFLNEIKLFTLGPKTYFEEIQKEVISLSNELKRLQSHRGNIFFNQEEVEAEIAAVEAKLNKFREIYTELEKDAEREKELSDLRREAEENYSRILSDEKKKQNKAVSDSYKARLKAYKKYLTEYQALKEREKEIEQEFSNFVNEIQNGGAESGPIDFIDASKAKFDAEQLLNAGDFQGAIDKAREAADMVRELGENGEYSTIELTGLAKMIERIATNAAGERSGLKLIDANEAKADADNIKAFFDKEGKLPLHVDQESLDQSIQAAITAAQEKLSQSPLKVKVEAITESLVDGVPTFSNIKVDPEAVKRSVVDARAQAQAEANKEPVIIKTIVDGVPTFSDGSDVHSVIDNEARKRGSNRR